MDNFADSNKRHFCSINFTNTQPRNTGMPNLENYGNAINTENIENMESSNRNVSKGSANLSANNTLTKDVTTVVTKGNFERMDQLAHNIKSSINNFDPDMKNIITTLKNTSHKNENLGMENKFIKNINKNNDTTNNKNAIADAKSDAKSSHNNDTTNNKSPNNSSCCGCGQAITEQYVLKVFDRSVANVPQNRYFHYTFQHEPQIMT